MTKSLDQEEKDLREQMDKVKARLERVEKRREAADAARKTKELLGIAVAICSPRNAREYGITRGALYSSTQSYPVFAAKLMGLGANILLDNDYELFAKVLKAILERAESIRTMKDKPDVNAEPDTEESEAGEDPVQLFSGDDAKGAFDFLSLTGLGMFEEKTYPHTESKKTKQGGQK